MFTNTHRIAQNKTATLVALALRQHGIVSVRQACRHGTSPRHLARSRYWVKCRSGLYRLAGFPSTWPSALVEAMATSPGAAVSHRAAAAIYGLDGFNGSSAPIEVSSTHKIRTRHGIVAHRVAKLPHCDLNRHEGLVVTSPTRTIIDLAGCVDEERLRIALDSALRQRLTSIAHLKRRLKELGTRGRRGAAAIGRLLRLYRCEAPSGSVLETKFENLCRRHHLDGFTRQYPVGQFRVDFAWPKSKVLVELDGFTYHANRSDHGRDLRRQNLLALKQPGWVLLRFNWFDVVAQPEAVVRTLRSALSRETGPEAGAGVEYQLQRRQS